MPRGNQHRDPKDNEWHVALEEPNNSVPVPAQHVIGDVYPVGKGGHSHGLGHSIRSHLCPRIFR